MLGSSQRALAAGIHHQYYQHHHFQPFVFQQHQQHQFFKQEVFDSCFPEAHAPVHQQEPEGIHQEPTSVLDLWSPSPSGPSSSTRGGHSSNVSRLRSSPDNRSNNSSESMNCVELIRKEEPPQQHHHAQQQWRSNVELIAEREMGRRSRDKSLDEWLADLQQQKLIAADDHESTQEQLSFGKGLFASASSASSSSDKHQQQHFQPQYGNLEELESMLLSPSSSSAPASYTQQLAKWLLGDQETSSQEIQIQIHHQGLKPEAEIFFSGKPAPPPHQVFQGLDQQLYNVNPPAAFGEPELIPKSFVGIGEAIRQGCCWPPEHSPDRKRKISSPVEEQPFLEIHRVPELQHHHQGLNLFTHPFAVPLAAEPKLIRSSPTPCSSPWGSSTSPAPRKLQRVEAINRVISGGFSAISTGSPLVSPNSSRNSQIHPREPLESSPATIPSTTVSVPDEGGLTLMDQLLQLAQAIDIGSTQVARSILARLNQHLFCHQQQQQQSKRIQRLAFYFKEALAARLNESPQDSSSSSASSPINHHHLLHSVDAISSPADLYNKLQAYSSFCEISPLLSFSYLSANQAILEATQGDASVHIVDFDPRFGTQWASLLQDLARSSTSGAGAPHLKLTLAGPDPARLGFIAESLREFATSLPILRQPEIHVVQAEQPGGLTAPLLGIAAGEPLVFNFMFSLHRALPDAADAAVAAVMTASPRLVTVAERELDDCDGRFQRRFVEVLKYYAFLLDSLGPDDSAGIFCVETEILSQEIRNAVAAEGRRRTERHLRLAAWRGVMTRGGLDSVAVSDVARMQGDYLIKRHPHGKNFAVEEEDGGLLIGWQGKNLVSFSAWAPADSLSAADMNNNNNIC